MFTPDVVLRAGDRNASVRRQVTVDGTPVTVTGATVQFVMFAASTTGGSPAVDAGGVVDDGPTGYVRYDWQAADVNLTPGFYFARFEITLSGKRLTAPNDGWIVVHVTGVGDVDWSYSGDPAARDLDWVRFNIGDTNSADPKITDAEIDALLAEEGDKYRAAVAACEMVAAVFTSRALSSKTVGDLSLSYDYGSRAKDFLDRATRLKVRAARRSGAAPVMAEQAARAWAGQFDYTAPSVPPGSQP